MVYIRFTKSFFPKLWPLAKIRDIYTLCVNFQVYCWRTVDYFKVQNYSIFDKRKNRCHLWCFYRTPQHYIFALLAKQYYASWYYALKRHHQTIFSRNVKLHEDTVINKKSEKKLYNDMKNSNIFMKDKFWTYNKL